MALIPRTVYTLGHSSRTLAELLSILRRYSIEILVDVRRYPRSRRHPWFNRGVLEEVLPSRGVRYVWLGDLLGGLGRDYVEYMCSREYREGIRRLEALIAEGLVAVMCAEAYWLRCHRRYIAESLAARGYEVLHIVDYGRVERHRSLREMGEELRCV